MGQNTLVETSVINSCGQLCVGSVNIYLSGACPPFTVYITGPSTFSPITAYSPPGITLGGLCQGSYQIGVVDCANYWTYSGFTINASATLPSLTFQVANSTCPTCSDGSLSISPAGGTAPYAISIYANNTSFGSLPGIASGVESFFGSLYPNQYVVTATDTFGCSVTDTVIVGNSANGLYSISGQVYFDWNGNGIRDSLEFGLPKQRVAISGTGSVAGTTIDGKYGDVVPPGNYTLSYQPIPGWSLSAASPPSFSVNVTSAGINNLDFGVIPDTTVPGYNVWLNVFNPPCGFPYVPFGLSINPPTFSFIIQSNTNLQYSAGSSNSFQTVNSSGCTVHMFDNQGLYCGSQGFFVPYYYYPYFSYQVSNASCASCNDGAISFSISGGVQPILQLNGVPCGTFVDTLTPGFYLATISDLCGNSFSDTIYVGTGANGYFPISGTVYLDINTNGIRDSGELGMANQIANVLPSNLNLFSFYNGQFGTVVPNGTYDVSYVPSNGWSLTSAPSNYNFTNSNVPFSGIEFGIYPDNPVAEGHSSLSYSFPRCNSAVTHYLNFINTGNMPLSGTMNFTFDPLMTYVGASPSPTSQSGNNLEFAFTNLYPGQSYNATVVLIEPAAGNTVNLNLTAVANDTLGNTVNSSMPLTQLVSCAYDPNDKQAFPQGIGPLNYVAMDQRIDYMIRFQNTGNDTAFHVVVLDTLDSGLDLSSFQIVGSSHHMNVQMDAQGALRFNFENILLPDSNVNEPASHGYVLYSVKGKATNQDPTSVYNTAYIYFDSNAPIQTNATLTTFSDNYLGLDEFTSSHLTVTPNPWSETASLECESCVGAYTLKIYDLLGHLVLYDSYITPRYSLIRGKLMSGSYLVELIPASGATTLRTKMMIR